MRDLVALYRDGLLLGFHRRGVKDSLAGGGVVLVVWVYVSILEGTVRAGSYNVLPIDIS